MSRGVLWANWAITTHRQTEHCHGMFRKLRPNWQGRFRLSKQGITENNKSGHVGDSYNREMFNIFCPLSVFPTESRRTSQNCTSVSVPLALVYVFSPACLNRGRPCCLHSPHLLKLKVQYFSLVKTHTRAITGRSSAIMTKIPALPSI